MLAERLTAAGAELGEGPVWRAESGEVVWVDILRGEIHATALDGSSRLVRQHAMPVGAYVDDDGRDLRIDPGRSDRRGRCRPFAARSGGAGRARQ